MFHLSKCSWVKFRQKDMCQICGLSRSLCEGKKRLLFLKHAYPSRVQTKKAEDAHPKHSFLPLEIDSEFNIQCLAQRLVHSKASIITFWRNEAVDEDSFSESRCAWSCSASGGGNSTGASQIGFLDLLFSFSKFQGVSPRSNM